MNIFSIAKNVLKQRIAQWKQRIAQWKQTDSTARFVNTMHVKKNASAWDRIGWKTFRASQNRPGGGTRVKRSGTNACNFSDLTVPSRANRAQWTAIYQKGLTPQGRCLGIDTYLNDASKLCPCEFGGNSLPCYIHGRQLP